MSGTTFAGTLELDVAGLAIARGGVRLAAGISFSLAAGQGLLVRGANGSGKSTLLRVIAGLLAGDAGLVTLHGGGERYPDLASASHYLGHLNAMKPALSVAENLSFWQQFHGPADLSVDAALATAGLTHVRELPFAYLSTGQKRRIAIAKLLLNPRPVWILDEPTAGLDAAASQQFSGLMRTHLHGGGLLIAATHVALGIDGLQSLRLGPASGAEPEAAS